MSICCNVLSPQEEWIASGSEVADGRERVRRMIDRNRALPVGLDINRARLFTESFKETEGQNISIRWGKALLHIAKNMPLYIGEDELIVGRASGRPGRNGILYPELDGCYLLDLEHADQRPVSPFTVTPEDFKILRDELYPYWKDKTYVQAYSRALPEETRQLIFGDDPDNFSKQQYVLSQTATARQSTNYNFNIERVLKNGLKKLEQEALSELEKISDDPAQFVEHGNYWKAGAMGLRALSIFIRRYAEEAQRLAKNEENLTRKAELEQIADTCFWISENPARDFRSAIQLQWFMLMFARLEQHGGASLGTTRMDQHLLPYYKQDIANGTITDAQVKELFECYWINLSQIPLTFVPEFSAKLFEAYAHFETVTVGGQTPNGDDATNELSYLILESKRDFPIPYPDLAARIHARSPEKFVRVCAEIIKEGRGFPKLFNDEEIVPLYLSKGATMAEALNYAVSGCTEVRIVDRETYITGNANINLGAVIEMTMNRGRLKSLGNKQIGPKTADPVSCKTFDEFFDAFKTQYEFVIKHDYIQQLVADQVKATMLAAPLASNYVGACRDAAVDIHQYVPNSIRENFLDKVGYATAIDSIAAVKKLVYEDKTISMKDLVAALDADFKGYEPLQQQLLHAPKYGNADPYADEVGRMMDKIGFDYITTHHGPHGEQFSDRVVPVTIHIPAGLVVGATPDGRNAWQYLSEGTSASHGVEQAGPTAVLLSNRNVKNEGYKERAARLLNIKFSPASIAGEEGTKKLISFIRTWCDLKLWHVQFNVVNKDTLIAAQKKPEDYQDLIVRVAGYSAYFNELSPMLQTELIERAEQAI